MKRIWYFIPLLTWLIVISLSCGKSSETASLGTKSVVDPKSEAVGQTDTAALDEPSDSENSAISPPEAVAPIFDVTKRTDHPPLDSKQAYVQWMLQHTQEEAKYLEQRWNLLQNDLAIYPNGTGKQTQEAYLRTPREFFIREYNLDRAYDVHPQVIEDGQTISGPYIVIRMTETLKLKPEHKVLEIGTGSGYQSAILSQITNNVYSIEIKPHLFQVTDKIYKSLYEQYPMYGNIHRKNADGYYGWKEEAPFDRIIVTCAIDHIPPPLLKQLAADGIMIIPVGPVSGRQVLLKITKNVDADGNITLKREDVYGGKILVKFVPFTKEGGGLHKKGN